MSKLIDVIIPAYNAASTISDTLRSLGTERSAIGALFVIDDSSTDRTGDVALTVAQSLGLPTKILPARCRDAGLARNIGLDASERPWIYFIDADDLHQEGGLRALLDLARSNPQAGMVAGSYFRLSDGRRRARKLPGPYGDAASQNACRYLTGRVSTIAMGSSLISRKAIGRTRFIGQLPYDEDTLFLAEVISRSPLMASRKPTLAYRVDMARADARFIDRPQANFMKWREALRSLEAHNVPVSVLKAREGLVAMKIARVHYARGDFLTASRFLKIAMRAPQPHLAASAKVLRYRLKLGWRKFTGNHQLKIEVA